VRPGDQAPATVLRRPMTHRRAGTARLPDLTEDLAERIRLFARDHGVARIAIHDLVPTESGRPFTGLVEEDEPPRPVENADAGRRRLRENLGELVAESELLLPRLGHPVSVPMSSKTGRPRRIHRSTAARFRNRSGELGGISMAGAAVIEDERVEALGSGFFRSAAPCRRRRLRERTQSAQRPGRQATGVDRILPWHG